MKYVCKVCKREFTPKSHGDKYCGKLCLAASITDNEQLITERKFEWSQSHCKICGRHKKYLIHKRMNGEWYLWQECHYPELRDPVLGCYFCNLWEKEYRKRNKKIITLEEHKKLIRGQDGIN